MKEIVRGLVLEGGGTRGAYQVGSLRALVERGFTFKYVTGSSIGAINGAIFASGNFHRMEDLYKTIKPEMIMGVSPSVSEYLQKREVTGDNIFQLFSSFFQILIHGGVDINPLKEMLKEYVDEKALRNSSMEFGLATYNLSKLSRQDLWIRDIPEGSLHDMIVASAFLPFFKGSINGVKYLDGGFYNNLPINLQLQKEDLEHLYVIRTKALGIVTDLDQEQVEMTVVKSDKELGGVLDFTPGHVEELMNLGYYDTLRSLDGYVGDTYYLKGKPEHFYRHRFSELSEARLRLLMKELNFEGKKRHPQRVFFETVLPMIYDLLDLEKGGSYEDLGVSLLEQVADYCQIDPYCVLDFMALHNRVLKELRNASFEPMKSKEKLRMQLPGTPISSGERKKIFLKLYYILMEES